MDAVQILSLFAPFAEAPAEQRAAMLADVTTAVLPAGSLAFGAGSRCPAVALVGAGRVRVAKMDERGHEISLYHVGPGESCLLTLSCALTGDPYAADGFVDESVEAALVPVERFRSWFDEYRMVRDWAIGSIAGRVVELMELVGDVAFHGVRARLAQFLHDTHLDGQQLLTITHDMIAAEIGASRETVSRLLKEYERAGVVELHRGSIRVLDRERLLALSGRP